MLAEPEAVAALRRMMAEPEPAAAPTAIPVPANAAPTAVPVPDYAAPTAQLPGQAPEQEQAVITAPEVAALPTAMPLPADAAPTAELPKQAPAPTAVPGPAAQAPVPLAVPGGALDSSAPVSVDDMVSGQQQQTQVAELPKSAEPGAPEVPQAPTWESRGLDTPTIPEAATVPAGMPDGMGGKGAAPDASPAPMQYSTPSQWEGDYWNFEGRGDTQCVSISPSTPDDWCTITCGTNPTGCPDNLCKCGEDAIKEADEIKQAARDNWNEAEQRIRGVKSGQSYPDGIPPSDVEVPGVHKVEAPAPLAMQCKSKAPFNSGAMDVWCEKNCARGPTSCSMIQCECEGGIPGATQAEEEQAQARAVGKAGPPEAHEEAMKKASDEAKASAGARALDDP